MHTSNPTISPANNKLLAQVNSGSKGFLRPILKQVTLKAGSIIYEPGQDANCIYLPTDMLVYQVLMLGNGVTSGLAIIGNEGIISPYALMGQAADNCTFKVLKSGSAFQLPVTDARQIFGIDSDMYQPVLDFVATWMRQINQTAVCLRAHTEEQQLCRWILIALHLAGNKTIGSVCEFATLMGLSEARFRAVRANLQLQGAVKQDGELLVVTNIELIKRLGCSCNSVL